MRGELILAVLLYIKRRVLWHERNFATDHHFTDKDGNELPAQASSIPKAVKRSIGGAIIESLVALDIDTKASRASHAYAVVMYALGDHIGNLQSGTAKINAVIRVNKEQGFAAIRELMDKAIEKLFR